MDGGKMISAEKESLLHRLDETRQTIEDLLPEIDPEKDIYPGWTIKQILAHITGWDDATIDALRAHGLGLPPSIPTIHSLDEYNRLTTSSRKDLTYNQILKEWRQTRQVLHDILEQLPDQRFLESIAVPWGRKTTITKLVNIFSHHEKEHAQDIIDWLKQPEKSLGKAGN
jgi:uncharacterized damage-inducible protein DinB